MEIKINKEGFLEIKRAGKFKKQECPFSIFSTQANMIGEYSETTEVNYYYKSCGDWCPLFGEPIEDIDDNCDETKSSYQLNICGKKFILLNKYVYDRLLNKTSISTQFTDERLK